MNRKVCYLLYFVLRTLNSTLKNEGQRQINRISLDFDIMVRWLYWLQSPFLLGRAAVSYRERMNLLCSIISSFVHSHLSQWLAASPLMISSPLLNTLLGSAQLTRPKKKSNPSETISIRYYLRTMAGWTDGRRARMPLIIRDYCHRKIF